MLTRPSERVNRGVVSDLLQELEKVKANAKADLATARADQQAVQSALQVSQAALHANNN